MQYQLVFDGFLCKEIKRVCGAKYLILLMVLSRWGSVHSRFGELGTGAGLPAGSSADAVQDAVRIRQLLPWMG